jgi:hypothetical protein
MSKKQPEDLTPEELDDLVRECLAEILNCAAAVAELQADDACREDIYAMTDLVASYYDVARTVIADTPDEPVAGSIRIRSLGDRFDVRDADDDAPTP